MAALRRLQRLTRDMVYGGDGQFSNPPNEPITLNSVPYQTRLRVFDERTGHLVRAAWSAAVTDPCRAVSTARWLSLAITASERLKRWLRPPPLRTACRHPRATVNAAREPSPSVPRSAMVPPPSR